MIILWLTISICSQSNMLGRVIDHILSAYLSSLLFTDRMINKELVCLIKQFGLVCCTNQGILLRSLIGRGVCCATP